MAFPPGERYATGAGGGRRLGKAPGQVEVFDAMASPPCGDDFAEVIPMEDGVEAGRGVVA